MLDTPDMLLPGTLVVVRAASLVRRFMSDEEHFTQRSQLGFVMRPSTLWREADVYNDRSIGPTYIVLFSSDSRMYYVPYDCCQVP